MSKQGRPRTRAELRADKAALKQLLFEELERTAMMLVQIAEKDVIISHRDNEIDELKCKLASYRLSPYEAGLRQTIDDQARRIAEMREALRDSEALRLAEPTAGFMMRLKQAEAQVERQQLEASDYRRRIAELEQQLAQAQPTPEPTPE